jgi:hypothetical protein
VNAPVDPAGAGEIAALVSDPPGGIHDPHRGKQVIEVQAAAPIPANDFERLPGGRRIGLRVTPIVVEMKRESDVKEKRDAAQCPRQTSQCDFQTASVGRQSQNDSGQVKSKSHIDGCASEELATHRGPLDQSRFELGHVKQRFRILRGNQQ